MKLADAAEYIKTTKATKLLLNILYSAKKVFNFQQERTNRLIRYVQITRAYKNGKPVKEIVDKFCCDKSTVLRYARMAEIPKRSKHFPEEIKKAVLKDCKKGLPQKVIAELHGVSTGYISTLEKNEGIKRYKKNV